MKRMQWLAATAAIAALAGCSVNEADNNMANADMNAMSTDNMALPPADMNADMNAMNGMNGMNADMNATTNATENGMTNVADNSTNTM